MQYEKKSDGIRIIGKEDFNPEHILECGQIFRYKKNSLGEYVVYSKEYCAVIKEDNDGYFIKTKAVDYFVNFFDLQTDYSNIKKQLNNIAPYVNEAIESGHGIRILRGDLFEIIVSFIISANNNIKRIKLIIERLCERVGTNMGNYYAFPTMEQFFELDEKFFKEIGAGYRASYLASLKNEFDLILFNNFSAMSSDIARDNLIKIKGVGPKVADCILLFGLYKTDVFPVDVWMERVYYEQFGNVQLTRPQISKDLTNRFGCLSGYLQQYLFYHRAIKK